MGLATSASLGQPGRRAVAGASLGGSVSRIALMLLIFTAFSTEKLFLRSYHGQVELVISLRCPFVMSAAISSRMARLYARCRSRTSTFSEDEVDATDHSEHINVIDEDGA
jgi:hypothetical protein